MNLCYGVYRVCNLVRKALCSLAHSVCMYVSHGVMPVKGQK